MVKQKIPIITDEDLKKGGDPRALPELRRTYKKRKPQSFQIGVLLKKGGDILSHIKMQYHLRYRA